MEKRCIISLGEWSKNYIYILLLIIFQILNHAFHGMEDTHKIFTQVKIAELFHNNFDLSSHKIILFFFNSLGTFICAYTLSKYVTNVSRSESINKTKINSSTESLIKKIL